MKLTLAVLLFVIVAVASVTAFPDSRLVEEDPGILVKLPSMREKRQSRLSHRAEYLAQLRSYYAKYGASRANISKLSSPDFLKRGSKNRFPAGHIDQFR